MENKPDVKKVEEIIATRGLKMTDLANPDMIKAVQEYMWEYHPELMPPPKDQDLFPELDL